MSMRLAHQLGAAVVFTLFISASATQAQTPYGNFEVQLGAVFPANPLLSERSAHVQRSPGGSIGFLLYSTLDDVVGLRFRGELGFHFVETAVPFSRSRESRKEYAVGVDAIPRFTRVVVRDLEARFYAGVGARLVPDFGDDVTVLGYGGYFDRPPNGAGAGATARAGWFFRRASQASLLRFDLSYQVGQMSGTLLHEVQFRVGFGSY